MFVLAAIGFIAFCLHAALGLMIAGWWVIDQIIWNAKLYAEFYEVLKRVHAERRARGKP